MHSRSEIRHILTPPHCSICGLKEGDEGMYPTQWRKHKKDSNTIWAHLVCIKEKAEYKRVGRYIYNWNENKHGRHCWSRQIDIDK